MPLAGGLIVPHPPIIIPEIAGERLGDVKLTAASMERAAKYLNDIKTEVLVIISPHSPAAHDRFFIKEGSSFYGSFTMFGLPDLSFEIKNAGGISRKIIDGCREQGIPVKGVSRQDSDNVLDHGVLVPYYFFHKKNNYSIVSLSVSGLPLSAHFDLGKVIGEVCEADTGKVVFIASGDLSHRLTPSAPAGYSPRGSEFDDLICLTIGKGELSGLMDIDEKLVDEAGECGLRSFVTLAGVMKNRRYDVKMLSYESPFGVGYLVSEILMKEKFE